MIDGVIVIGISVRGVEKVKLYHTEKEKGILDLYKKLIPLIKQIDIAALGVKRLRK